MEDIYSLMIQVKREHKKDAYHFIGSIVNLRRGDGSFYEREIIDGQQRLTTIFLILYALRDIAIKQENKDVENSLRNYLENIAATGQNEKYHNKLKPNLTDDGVLQKIIDQRINLMIKERTEKLAKMFNIKFPYFSSCLQLDGAKQYEIYLNIDDIKATASIYMSGKTVVHMGSVIKENARAMLQVKNRRIEMMNRGDLSYDSNTKLFTVRKDISFLSLTEATKFIYGGCNDGWLLWTTKDGECLNDTIRYKIEKLMKD